MIAAKYEEVRPPKIHDFLYVCDGAYDKKDILVTEHEILREIKYKVKRSTFVNFMDHIFVDI